MAVEVVGGFLTGSLALIADAGHMFTDVAGVSMALFAIWFAARPADRERTYGYYRLEMFAALANGVLLVGVAAYILFEAYGRFSDPPDILGWPMLGVAFIGLLVNLGSAYLLFEGQKTSLNLKGAFLEVVSDLLGSVAVILAGAVILTTGFDLVDPIASVFIGLFILPRTWHLMGEAVDVLLEGAPRNVNLDHVREHILGTENAVGLHDLHVWSMTSGMPVMSAHVVIQQAASASRVLDELCRCLEEHFDIEHSTFQIERAEADRSAREHAAH
jgi:cobalt-zinc-cadmium efflux system protein